MKVLDLHSIRCTPPTMQIRYVMDKPDKREIIAKSFLLEESSISYLCDRQIYCEFVGPCVDYAKRSMITLGMHRKRIKRLEAESISE